jgi:hypothetical protein
MITGSLLIPAIEPLVTGEEYHHQLLIKLCKHVMNDKDLELLASIINRLNNQKNQAAGNSLIQLRSILRDSKSMTSTPFELLRAI